MKKVLVIVGPTGVGKTGLALKLAKAYDGELISADSRQLYKALDIATGKEVELLREGWAEKCKGYWIINGIKVNLYDECEIGERFTVADFKRRAEELIQRISNDGKLPIVVGGTGLYISALTENYQFPAGTPESPLRERLATLTKQELIEELNAAAPESLQTLDSNNPARLRRALEVFHTTGSSIQDQQKKADVEYDFFIIGLTRERETLYKHVDQQVLDWMQLGLIEETKQALKKHPEADVLNGIHYKQVQSYLRGNLTKAELIEKIQFERHSYIRRQYTWFKKMKAVQWFDVDTELDQLNNTITQWFHAA